MSRSWCGVCGKDSDYCDCEIVSAEVWSAAVAEFRWLRRRASLSAEIATPALDKLLLDEKTDAEASPTTCAGDTGSETAT